LEDEIILDHAPALRAIADASGLSVIEVAELVYPSVLLVLRAVASIGPRVQAGWSGRRATQGANGTFRASFGRRGLANGCRKRNTNSVCHSSLRAPKNSSRPAGTSVTRPTQINNNACNWTLVDGKLSDGYLRLIWVKTKALLD
jgi:hypothetical protein